MRRASTRPRGRPAKVVVATLLISLVGVTAAIAAKPQPAIDTFTPHHERDIPNLDVLRQQIRNYYGDPLGTGTFSGNSYYAQEARGVAQDGADWLLTDRNPGDLQAIILDVDDTTLATWNYEIFSNWAFNPTTNAQFVTDQRFPAVPGMLKMVTKAANEGYAIIFLTGRPASQESATLGNLTSDGVGQDVGYPQPATLNDGEDGLFTKPATTDYGNYPYLQTACAAEIAAGKSCTTVHYKSATRAHIESLGYDIVANFGDQFSDLIGGHADRTFKLPNPNYFLP
jgi:hypothetical protein